VYPQLKFATAPSCKLLQPRTSFWTRCALMPSMTCKECGAELRSIDEVIQHAESAHPHSSHSPPEDFLCPGCPASFRQILQLQRHLSEAHGFSTR
jgi:uncharacterized C2H2 Zn-finger protein